MDTTALCEDEYGKMIYVLEPVGIASYEDEYHITKNNKFIIWKGIWH